MNWCGLLANNAAAVTVSEPTMGATGGVSRKNNSMGSMPNPNQGTLMKTYNHGQKTISLTSCPMDQAIKRSKHVQDTSTLCKLTHTLSLSLSLSLCVCVCIVRSTTIAFIDVTALFQKQPFLWKFR